MMDIVLLTARLVLVAVFAVAGFTKLTDRDGTVQAMVDFGLPLRWAPSAALLLPFAELAVALALIPGRTAALAASGGMTLLIVFSAAIAVNLARGRRPRCHCFGNLDASPIGMGTLVRNAVLTMVAFIVAWQWPGRHDPSGTELLLVLGTFTGFGLVVGEAIVAIRLLCRNTQLLGLVAALQGPKPVANDERSPLVGTSAPAFTLPSLDGANHTLASLLRGGLPLLLIFISPNCWYCRRLVTDLRYWQRDRVSSLHIVFVSRGDRESNQEAFGGLDGLLIESNMEVSLVYGVRSHPGAILIHQDGTVDGRSAAGLDGIVELVEHVSGTRVRRRQPPELKVRVRRLIVQRACQSNRMSGTGPGTSPPRSSTR